MRRIFLLIGFVCLVTLIEMSSLAQSTSTLSGTVRDSSGAVIPGALITVKNQASGDERTTISTRDGVFSVPALRAGTYKVAAAAQGFAAFEVTDVVLSAQDNKSLNITLPLETVSATVVVSAKADSSIIEEDTGAKAETITADDLQSMTMSSRNAAEVVKLMSGATLSANGGVNKSATTNLVGMNSFTSAGTAAGLGGTRINGQSVDLTMDGSHDFDPGSYGQNTPVNPNMDMISELKVLSSSFSAEYEHGPVVVNVETKGGGSQYHGQVHFYAQNSALNAVDSTVKQNKAKVQDTHQYYPGGQISGPLPAIGRFNKNRDKLFFFDGFEVYRQHLAPGVVRAVVPTEAMYNGDFSPGSNPGLHAIGNLNPYVDSQGNVQNVPKFDKTKPYAAYRSDCLITDNKLSSGCISQQGLKMMKSYFAVAKAGLVDPATHNGWNYVNNVTTDLNQWQNVARVDWSISDSTKFYIRVNTSRESANNPMGVWGTATGDEVLPAPTLALGNNTADNISASLTKVFSPTLTSESSVTWGKVTMPNKPSDSSVISRSALGLPGTIWGQDALPSLTAWSSSTFPGLGPGGYYVGKPMRMMADKLTPSGKETVTKVLGAHTLKAGVYYEFVQNKQNIYGNFNGTITMTNGWGQDTGNTYADMLMGIIGNEYMESQLTPIIANNAKQLRFFITDHWKVNHRLTVDVGMRFDHMGKPYPSGKLGYAVWQESQYNNDASSLNAHTGVSWHGMDSSISKSGVASRVLFYSPRFGLAYDLTGRGSTILRGGLGIFYAYDSIGNDQYKNAAATAYGAASFDCPYSSCPVLESLSSSNPYLAPYAAHTIPAGIASGLQSVDTIDPHLDNQPHVVTYNLQVDQKLPWKFMLEASYVGNYGQDNIYTADINAIRPGRIQSAWNLACVNAGNCNYASGTDPSGAYWRPRQNYQAINKSILAGKTQYDGLQLSAHRSSGILFLLTNFTWGKSYSNAAVANGGSYASLSDYGASTYWGVSPDNRKFTFNASYTVSIPRINLKNRTLRETVNGWQINGITQWSSGPNLISNSGGGINYGYGYNNDTVITGTGSNAVTTTTATHDNIGLIGANQATVFPTLTCDPRVHQRVAPSSSMPVGGIRFLNSACFAPTTSGLGTTHPAYFPGPAFINSDLGVMKTVKITERQNVQFKLQAFNFLNHPLWSFNSADANLKLTFNGQRIENGVVTQQGGVLSSASQNFGVASMRTGSRTVQLEVRYWF